MACARDFRRLQRRCLPGILRNMYELAPKFRYALKWLLRGAAGLVVIAAVFATALPYLVEVHTVRDGLVKNLSQWSGGPVSIHGPLRMKSFASLSIEAEGVSFSATPRLSPIDRIEAKSVTAILKVPSLLRGRVEFKKVSVAAPRIVLGRRADLPRRTIIPGSKRLARPLLLPGRAASTALSCKTAHSLPRRASAAPIPV